MLVQVWVPIFAFQLLPTVLGKTVHVVQRSWEPATNMGDVDGVDVSWLLVQRLLQVFG